MTLNEQQNLSKDEQINNDYELLNLKNAIFKKQKNKFLFQFLAGLFLSFLFVFQRDTWKGEFEIVLEEKNQGISSRLGSVISGLNSQLLEILLAGIQVQIL